MSGRLAGRRAIVTGAARGIGAAIAATFAEEGATVALIDVLADEVAATAASIGGAAYVVDLRDAEATRATIGEAIAAMGGIDVLVNNAGILRFARLPRHRRRGLGRDVRRERPVDARDISGRRRAR